MAMMTQRLQLYSTLLKYHSIAVLVSFLVLGQSINAKSLQTIVQGEAKPTISEFTPLELEKYIRKEIPRNEGHTYQVNLEVGQYAQVTVTQEGIDLEILLFAPDGQSLRKVNLLDANQGAENLFWIAEIPGKYRLPIQPVETDGNHHRGSYEVCLRVLRVATEPERSYVKTRRLAEETSEEVVRLYLEGGEESQRQAIATAKTALTLWQQLEERSLEAWMLLSLGIIHAALQEQQIALSYYDHALPIFATLKNLSGQAQTLEMKAYADFKLEEQQKAITSLEQAQKLYGQYGALVGATRMTKAIARSYHLMGETELAVAGYQQALQQYREEGNRLETARILTYWSDIHRNLGEVKPAIEKLQQALELARKMNLSVEENSTLETLAELYGETRNGKAAIEIYQQLLQRHQEQENTSAEAKILLELGELYVKAGSREVAIATYEEDIQLYRRLKQPGDEAFSLWKISSTYYSTSDYAQALEYSLQAKAIWETLEDKSWQANILQHIGFIYEHQG